MPVWFHGVAIASLALGVICSGVICADLVQRPQHMWIMNAVWPLVALFGSVLVLTFYGAYGRAPPPGAKHGSEAPRAVSVAKSTLHCGAGCTLGDILAEWLAFAVPSVALWFGWKNLFAEKMFAVWILDYIAAFALGIAFQYFTIAPMRDLGPMEGLTAALKADALSLTAWQLGMYGFMAFAKFYLFAGSARPDFATNSVAFWFMMQIAMLCGFATSYPVNWWLLRAGLKEVM